MFDYKTIIEGKLHDFKKLNGYEKTTDNAAFEIFVNQLITRKHHSVEFKFLNDNFDLTNVGGGNDSGIDGICIRVNDVFVYSVSDIENVIKGACSIKVEYIFIQSKYKESIDSGEMGVFISGIKNIIRDNPIIPINDKIACWIELKNYLNKKENLSRYQSAPKIYAFYAYLGNNIDDDYVVSKIKEAEEDSVIKSFSDDFSFKILDGKELFEICRTVDDSFEQTFAYSDYFEFVDSSNIESSGILFCGANDLFDLIVEPNSKELRRELFGENVRDYQGETAVNREIYETLVEHPSKFCLLNNGITIICKSLLTTNRKITLKNPQIVNGCQTCSTLYRAFRDGVELSKVNLVVKVISTKDPGVINSIIKGTNRQNVVYSESFEITREFHKRFEDFVKAIQNDTNLDKKIFYERRSKQMEGLNDISRRQIFSFKTLIQSYISTFMLEPNRGFEHEINLLERFDGQIFKDDDDFLPYYASAKLAVRVDQLFAKKYESYHLYGSIKYQLMCLFIHLVAGRIPALYNRKNVKDYCGKILDVLDNEIQFEKEINNAIGEYTRIKETWIAEKGFKFRHAIKDNSLFTEYMLDHVGFKYDKFKNKTDQMLYEGIVTAVKTDRNGLRFAFIEADPEDIFVHEDNNPKTHFNSLKGKKVKYKIISSSKYGNPRGQIVKVFPRDSEQCD